MSRSRITPFKTNCAILHSFCSARGFSEPKYRVEEVRKNIGDWVYFATVSLFAISSGGEAEAPAPRQVTTMQQLCDSEITAYSSNQKGNCSTGGEATQIAAGLMLEKLGATKDEIDNLGLCVRPDFTARTTHPPLTRWDPRWKK